MLKFEKKIRRQKVNHQHQMEIRKPRFTIFDLTGKKPGAHWTSGWVGPHIVAKRNVSALGMTRPTVTTVQCTVMLRLTTEIHYEKCVVRRLRRCANAIQCIYANLDSTAYYTPSLYGTAYCS